MKFINRCIELSYLRKEAQNSYGFDNKVIFLKGISGVGKSSLTKKFLEETKYPGIKISIDKSAITNFEDGYFIKKIALEVDKYSVKTNNIDSLEIYQKQLKSIIQDDKIWEIILNETRNFVSRSDQIKNTFFHDTLVKSNSNNLLYLLTEYLSEVFRNNSFILNIENIQTIDALSLEIFIKLIEISKGSIFLLEFTYKSKNKYIDLINKLQKFDLTIYDIPPLSLENIHELLRDSPDVVLEIINKSFSSWDGNLLPLKDIFYTVKNGIEINSNYGLSNASKLHLRSLQKSEIFFLFIILCHIEPVEIEQIKELNHFDNQNFITLDVYLIIESLEKRKLIKINENQISIYHDSIQDILLDIQEKSIMLPLANRFWLDFYEENDSSENIFYSKSYLLSKLLYYSTSLNLNLKILSLLDRIKNEATKSITPKKMINYVVQVKNELEKYEGKNQLNKIRFWLIEIYQNLGIGKEALTLLNEISYKNKNLKVLNFILLEMTGQQDIAIEMINIELQNVSKYEVKYELVLRLIRLQSMYDLGNTKYCKKEFHKIYGKKKFINEFEYGFLLRNAELVFDYNNSIPFYLESIEHFENRKAFKQSSFSRITLSIHLGLVGKFEDAQRELNLASEHLVGNISERHTILNNKAVFLLYEGNIKVSIHLFRQALNSAELDFDRFAISSNLLAAYDILKLDNYIPQIVKNITEILKSPKFSTQRILWYSYYNLYRYYKRINDAHSASIYFDKLNEKPIHGSHFWKHWIMSIKTKKSHEDYFRYKLERPFSYLTHWSIEFNSTLMNYE